ncbi:MAG: FtsX-like permease family protein [Bacteroidota bacterium]
MKSKVNYEIAFTHILTRKKLTLVAAAGVTIGIALYIFANSIVSGVDSYSKMNMFKTIPHLAIHVEDKLSEPLTDSLNGNLVLISNPKIITTKNTINNPYELMGAISTFSFVKNVAPQVNVDLFYNVGKSQMKGTASGIKVEAADAMFDITSTMKAGDLPDLSSDLNGIVVGSGIAKKLNLQLNDNITVISSFGVTKVLKVIGIFSTDNQQVDESKSYINLSTAQQLIQESSSSVTDIYVQLSNPDSSAFYAQQVEKITEYQVDDWQITNADQLAQSKMTGMMTPLISFSIMLVAAFGIYNIINMTISQKMNDIAILKANGFKGKDIITIFLSEAFVMGFVGTFLGVTIGAVMVHLAKGIYVGPPIGYFPIQFDPGIFISGIVFGLVVALGAGYFPARKASKVDPVEIFRR